MKKRVGMVGVFLECNRFSPVTTAAMFAQGLDLTGAELQEELAQMAPRTLPDTHGFMQEMSRTANWDPVALRMAAAQPGGPAEAAFFEDFVQDMELRLKAQGPFDGIFISSHGAALSTANDDPDGQLFTLIRRCVGPDVPIVAVLDLHCNVSDAMTEALSAFVAYRTNPHTDLKARGVEAAQHLQTFWHEGSGAVAHVKLPLVPPATAQLLEPGTVYQALMEEGQRHVAGAILNVSLCAGFALSDAPKCGFSVVVTARHGCAEQARALAGQ